MVEDEVDMAGVITLAEKRAEIKTVIVKRDLAPADRRVVAIRQGHCHDLYNDEDEGKRSHGRRTFRVFPDCGKHSEHPKLVCLWPHWSPRAVSRPWHTLGILRYVNIVSANIDRITSIDSKVIIVKYYWF